MIPIRIIFGMVALVIFLLPAQSSQMPKFYGLTTILALYNIIELRNLYLQRLKYFFLSPIFISVLVSFGLVYGGVVNFLMYTDNGYLIKGFGHKIISEPEWLSKTMVLACFASLATWIGYYSWLGPVMHKKLVNLPLYHRILTRPADYNRILFVALLAYLVKFYLFSIGLYGRLVSEEYFEGVTGFKAGSQIRILGDLSYITFFAISIIKFKDPSSKNNLIFAVCLILELFFGFLYGARSAFITPFLILLISYYYAKRKLGIITLSVCLAAVYLAFTLVLDFKNYVLSKDFRQSKNSIELIENFNERQNRFVNSQNDGYKINSAFKTTLFTITFVPETGVAIRQKDKLGMDGLSNPNILATLAKVPFDAFVPRFIQGQNEFAWGYWFKEEVAEVNPGLKYSIAMSPIGFLYMGGGAGLVLIGFWFYGVLLRFTYPFLLRNNLFSLILYLMLLSSLYNLDSIYSNSIIYMLRYTFIYSVVFWLLFDSAPFKSGDARTAELSI